MADFDGDGRVRKAWTAEEASVLRRMYAAGSSNAQIAAVLCRSELSVKGRVALLKRRQDLFSSAP
jgi:DNA-binding NarL/FixJ family response regulator